MTETLVGLTWLAWVLAAMGAGTLVVRWVLPTLGRRDSWLCGLWVGTALVLGSSALLSLVTPLTALAGRWGTFAILGVGWCSLIALLARGRLAPRGFTGVLRQTSPFAAGILALFLAGWVLLARFATLAPTDYDAGLYRLSAIRVASELGVAPGLANFRDNFGFNSLIFPWGAMLQNVLWGEQAFRLLTGVVATVLLVDLLLRLAGRRAGGSRAGDRYMVMACAFMGGLLLTNPGRWVSSPAQDVIFLALCIGSTAFLVDVVQGRGGSAWTGGASLVAAAVAGAVRPLGWLLLIVSAVVVVVVLRRRRATRDSSTAGVRALWLATAISAALALIMAARDAVLSGWVLYPLALLPLPVPWRVPDPSATREWITSWARAPGLPKDLVLADWDWLGPWFTRTIASSTVALVLIAALPLLLTMVSSTGRRAWRRAGAAIAWASVPTLVVLVAWWISAPDPRFGWAFIINVVSIPAALVFAAGAWSARVQGSVAVSLLVIVLVPAIAGRVDSDLSARVPTLLSLGPVSVTAELGTVPQPVLTTRLLPNGLEVGVPVAGDQCWDAPLVCGPVNDAVPRGPSVAEGFLPPTTPR